MDAAVKNEGPADAPAQQTRSQYAQQAEYSNVPVGNTEKTLKQYYKDIRTYQFAKFAPAQVFYPPDLKVSQLSPHTREYTNTLQELQKNLAINSPEHIISQSRCDLLENRLSQQRSELVLARKRISELEYKSSTDISIEQYNALYSKSTYYLYAKDAEIQRLKAIVEKYSQEISKLQAGCLINTADCEKKVLDARYEQYSKIVARATRRSSDSEPALLLEKKYNELLRKHEISLQQMGEVTQLVDQLKQENSELILQNLDLRKENAVYKNKLMEARVANK